MKLIYFLKSQQKNSSKCHREHLAKYELKIMPIWAFSRRVYGAKKNEMKKKIENPHTKAFTCSCCFVWFSFILFSGCSSCDLFSVIFRSVASIFIDVLRRHWIAVRFGFICILLSRTHTNTHERRHRTQYEGIYYWKARIFVFKNVL